MDGSFHPLDEPFYSHVCCRCVVVPKAKSWAEMGYPDMPDRTWKPKETGEEAFAQLSESEQRAILGPGKYELYAKGDLKLSDLVKEGHDERWGPYRVEKTLKDLTSGRSAADAVGVKRAAEHAEVEKLVKEVLETGRALEVAERDMIVKHVAGAWFSPRKTVTVGGAMVGMEWEGRNLVAGDLVPTDVAHYLKHARLKREWPEGTTLESYGNSARRVVKGPDSAIAISLYRGQPHLTFLGPSGPDKGDAGFEYIVVDYRVGEDAIRTAYQPAKGPGVMMVRDRKSVTWIRELKR